MTQHYHAVTPLFNIINADTNTTVALPAPSNQPVAPEGLMFLVVDNMGTAGTTNIAITGPISGGTTGTSITTNYGSALFFWIASGTFIQINGP